MPSISVRTSGNRTNASAQALASDYKWRRLDRHLGMKVDQWIIGSHSQQTDLAPLLRKLAQALREKRMVFSQETADDKNRIQALDFRKLEAEPRDTLEFGVGGKITPARTEIDISRTDPGHQLLEQIQLFKR